MRPLLTALALAASTALTATAAGAEMTQTDIREGFRTHAALAQFHRWFQVYERPEGGIENAVDILAEDVVVTSGLGTASGHGDYAARVQSLPAEWRNAHVPSDVTVTHSPDGSALTAKVTYLNQGLLPDGAVRSADLTYEVALAEDAALLPKIAAVTITQDAEGTAEAFRDAYALNRTLSLVHYWLAIIEDPARDPEPAREILADGFTLDFSSGAITDFEGFAAWLAGPGSQVAASTHEIEGFAVMETGENAYDVTMEFDWAGITPDGTELVARTRHSWQVVNDPTERFARIKRVGVEVLEPFRPKG